MKKKFKYMMITMIVLFILVAWGYTSNTFGLYGSYIEKDARKNHKISSNWSVQESITNQLCAMLFYDENLSDHTVSIYVNRNGISFGYFFRAGGSILTENTGIAECRIGDYKEKIYLSLNKEQISKIEIDDGTMIRIIDIDDTQPFTIILSDSIGIITLYNRNGEIVHAKSYYL